MFVFDFYIRLLFSHVLIVVEHLVEYSRENQFKKEKTQMFQKLM